MGRTYRRRSHKQVGPGALDHEENVVNLRKFMSRHGFKDNLNLRDFPDTGRGVSSPRKLHENDVIITVPLGVMITYATLKSSSFVQFFSPQSKLTIHDLLSCFLVYESHKKDSFWKHYINSLPSQPPWLPALLSEQHIELLPPDLRLATKKSRRLLDESWTRIQKSMKKNWTCGCCGRKADCVIDWNVFVWGFVMVNTRAVYVKPEVIRDLSEMSEDLLSDEPCMALCPFLDMFNHSDKAKTRAELSCRDGKWEYQLTTLTKYEKHEQVFISYGEHDNTKLLVEYGFFIPGNCYDTVAVERDQLLRVLGLNVSYFRYKFLSKHGLDTGLFFTDSEPSFNLTALLYVSESEDHEAKRFTSAVYTGNYPQEFLEKTLKVMCRKLLNWEVELLDAYFRNVNFFVLDPHIVSFLINRLKFVLDLYDKYK